MAWNGENLATLFHEEYPNRHIQVSVAGLLVVVEDADTVFRATEDTPPLFPALMEGKERGGRGEGEGREEKGVGRGKKRGWMSGWERGEVGKGKGSEKRRIRG